METPLTQFDIGLYAESVPSVMPARLRTPSFNMRELVGTIRDVPVYEGPGFRPADPNNLTFQTPSRSDTIPYPNAEQPVREGPGFAPAIPANSRYADPATLNFGRSLTVRPMPTPPHTAPWHPDQFNKTQATTDTVRVLYGNPRNRVTF